jgi:hypothetical protein
MSGRLSARVYNLADCFLGLVQSDIEHVDACTAQGKAASDGSADAAGCAGDDSGLSVETKAV